MTRVARTPYPAEVKAEAIRRMGAGENPLTVGADLDVPRATIYQWKNDPTGERNRARKERYRGVCIDCGGPTSGNEGHHGLKRSTRCAGCFSRYLTEAKLWTRERIVLAIQEWVEKYGTPPAASDWSLTVTTHPAWLRGGEFPSPRTVLNAFGKWNVAIEAAGFEPRANYGKGGRGSLSAEDIARTLALYEEYGTYTEVAKVLNMTPNGVALRLQNAGVIEPRSGRMPTYRAETAIDRDIERTEEAITRLEGEVEERRQYLAALKAAQVALAGTTNGTGSAE